jgi:ubiquinone/menaquinone biosynthesis C-methylase UbiE
LETRTTDSAKRQTNFAGRRNSGFHYRKNSVRIRYTAQTAADYDQKRAKRRKWKREMKAVAAMVADFSSGSVILDTPVGTGRFIPLLLDRASQVIGLDISCDMLDQARAKFSDPRLSFVHGDTVHIPLENKSVDYVICIRLLNWVMESTMEKIVAEFRRVARREIVIGFRSQQPMSAFDFARYGLFALLPTPRHLRRWLNGGGRFFNRIQGKLRHEYRRLSGNQSRATPAGQRPLFIQTYYDERKTLDRLAGMGLELVERCYIDSLSSHPRLKIFPYFIYRFRVRDMKTSREAWPM